MTGSTSHASSLATTRIPRSVLLVVLFLATLFFLLAVADTAAARDHPLRVDATDGGGQHWFEIRGYPGENPTVSFASGDQLDVWFYNIGQEGHNLRFEAPLSRATQIIGPGDATRFTLLIPTGLETQLITYRCDIHRNEGMWGWILLGDEIDASGREAVLPHRDIPAPGIVPILGALVFLGAMRRALRSTAHGSG